MKAAIDLLPDYVHRRAAFRVRLRQWSVVWGAVLVAGLFATARLGYLLHCERVQLATLETQAQPLHKVQEQMLPMRRRLAELKGRESLLGMLSRIEQPVQLMGILGRAAVADQQDIQVLNFSFGPSSQFQAVETTTSDGEKQSVMKPVDRMQMTLDGLGVDDLAVARFVAALRESTVFEMVSLKSSVRMETASEKRKFTVECVIY